MPGDSRRQAKIREIESATNPLVKVFRRALAEGVTRDGLLAVEGPHLLEEALTASPRATVHSVLIARGSQEKFTKLLARLPMESEVVSIPDRLFAKMAQTESPQGIAALVELRRDDLTAVLARPNAIALVACGLQEPGNLGSMMRSAQALGASALVTLEETVSPFNPKAVRASAGAVFRLPIFHGLKPHVLFERLRAAGVAIVAADRHSPSPLAQADLRGSVAFLIGKEATGLRPEILREANLLLSIPIRPEADSVNAAAAAGIFLYEAARQRGFNY
ncbi:MAG TPA: RNA methyltransferase [Terriglobia bacterium]|nr:RNA methyltransferase [Terriglobia bacterium]